MYKFLLFSLFFFNISAGLGGLQVGSLIRNQNDVEAFVKFYAFIQGIPASGLSAFLIKQGEQVKAIYLDLLRKKEFILAQDSVLLKLPSIKQEVKEKMSQVSKKLVEYKIPTYIAEEFFLINIAYKKLSERLGNLGVKVSEADMIFESNLVQKKIQEYNSYGFAEILLDMKYFHGQTEKTIMDNIGFLLKQMPLELFALAFGKNISVGVGGSMGLINEKLLSFELNSMASFEKEMFLVKRNSQYWLYIQLGKFSSKLNEKELKIRANKNLFMHHLQTRQYGMLWDAYSGVVNIC